VFLNIQIAGKLKKLIDFKVQYWCLLHNILLSGQGIEFEKSLAWRWKFTAHGNRGCLSKLRHDIKNKLTVEEGKDIIDELDATEANLLFEKKLNSDLKHAFKTADKSILKVLRERTDMTNANVKDLFKKLNDAFSRHKSHELISPFKETVENLQEFLGML